jgi:hypothetical protein
MTASRSLHCLWQCMQVTRLRSAFHAQRRIAEMLKTPAVVPEEQHVVLSDLPPSRAQKRLAFGVVLGLIIALYLVVGPFGGMQLRAIHSFVAVFTTAMFVTDSITAILLYGQFSILRSRAILIMASGYLFTALLIVPYTLAFPGVLAPYGLIGGLQTSRQRRAAADIHRHGARRGLGLLGLRARDLDLGRQCRRGGRGAELDRCGRRGAL